VLNKNFMRVSFLLGILYLFSSLNAGAQVVSPVTQEPYIATIEDQKDTAYAGEPYFIHLSLYPKTLPPGFTLSTLVDLLEYPKGAKPEIVTGFPEIRVNMAAPGTYTMSIRLSLISKSSCAGVDAEELFEKTLFVEVMER